MATEREKEILNFLGKKSPLTVEELAASLHVSEVTVRRDLTAMERQGLIVRKRGGASLPELGFEPMFNQRQKKNIELKQAIAKYAASMIQEGEVIALDVGTTTAELARELAKRSGITVFTSCIQVASILAKSNLQVYMIGGLIRKSEMSMVGSIAQETILKFNFDRFYLGIAGISQDAGPTDYSIEETEIKRAFIQRSKEVVALVDRTKFGESSLIKVCEAERIDEVITNGGDFGGPHPEAHFRGKITYV
ncbi:DeoR/GlpR family DNA-binding transcription regulator [Brevibacillus brevis]|uniref:DeoR/GlpR family DNA-binding transcription regulator n=1 Tax=Brevibacillus brevis TaxID=1393 RepID=A0ABY9T6E5_BREBE|nr:DeoR/GlpR family DNA-binding transcription regulator [Brevibacillus brevis]WNC15667.1 DeoR/GlpR family DNA-binding transcription regulator [Brevibacillus brevis]